MPGAAVVKCGHIRIHNVTNLRQHSQDAVCYIVGSADGFDPCLDREFTWWQGNFMNFWCPLANTTTMKGETIGLTVAFESKNNQLQCQTCKASMCAVKYLPTLEREAKRRNLSKSPTILHSQKPIKSRWNERQISRIQFNHLGLFCELDVSTFPVQSGVLSTALRWSHHLQGKWTLNHGHVKFH